MRRAFFTACLTLICSVAVAARLASWAVAATTNGTVPADNLIFSSTAATFKR
jgi:hypothetical protein